MKSYCAVCTRAALLADGLIDINHPETLVLEAVDFVPTAESLAELRKFSATHELYTRPDGVRVFDVAPGWSKGADGRWHCEKEPG